MEAVLPSLCTSNTKNLFSSLVDSNQYITNLSISTAYFGSVVLSYWDNIYGPRLQHLWLGSGEKQPKDSCIKYVVSRTLHGELLRESPENVIDSKLHIIKEHDLVCVSFIFMGYSTSGQCMFSLTLLLPYSKIHLHIRFHEMVEIRMKILLAKLRVLQQKDLSSARSIFSSYLPSLFSVINSLQLVGVPDQVPFNDCIFGADHEASMDDLFLRRVITSFLQTFGCTVIVGKNIKTINLLVNTLALFLSPNERSRSRYAMEGQGYEPDMFVQGLHNKDDEESFSCPGIIISQYPTTLIDLDHMTVKQTQAYHQHEMTRHQFLDIELTFLWRGDQSAPMYPTLGVFHESDDIAILVQNFMTEISVLPSSCGIRQAFIDQFNRLLNRKALALMKYTANTSCKGARNLEATDIKNLKMDLCLSAEADFRVILVRGDKLQPGLYSFVMGSAFPAKQVKDMLEAL